MSWLELLGTLANASQLIHYTIQIAATIVTISQRASEAHRRIYQQSDQIYLLENTALLITQNPSLQTPTVNAHVESTLVGTEALLSVLGQIAAALQHGVVRKRWAILQGGKEKEIATIFDRLERKITALILCGWSRPLVRITCTSRSSLELKNSRTVIATFSANAYAGIQIRKADLVPWIVTSTNSKLLYNIQGGIQAINSHLTTMSTRTTKDATGVGCSSLCSHLLDIASLS